MEDDDIIYDNNAFAQHTPAHRRDSLITDGKKLDICQHLRLNLNQQNNCKDNNRSAYYCIPCKVSICDKCNYDLHKNHILISKEQYDLNDLTIDNTIDAIEMELNSYDIIKDAKAVKTQLMNQLDEMISKLEAKVQQLKQIKTKEINYTFDMLNNNIEALFKNLTKTREDLKQYANKNTKFFNLTPLSLSSREIMEPLTDRAGEMKYNNDSTNTIFLINYEMLNICNSRKKDISLSLQSINTTYEIYQEYWNKFSMNILTNADNVFFTNIDDNGYHNENDTYIETTSYEAFNRSVKSLGATFTDINTRITKYNHLFESFKKYIFNSVAKNGNLKEIESLVSSMKKRKKTASDAFFVLKQNDNKTSMLKSNRTTIAQFKIKYHTNEDVILNHQEINKYFAQLVLQCYEKHFKMVSKDLQSSHADLLINKKDSDDEKDFGKTMENTNILSIYTRKDEQLSKLSLPLKRNPIGYTKFPIGCRSLIIGDKVYITGGKDEKTTYKIVLIYNIVSGQLKRIIDLNDARCFHTMIYSEIFQTLLVIGGEKCSTVELFDPLTNRWIFLPTLNSPRANPCFQFDTIRGILYVLFGNAGEILGSSYSNEIEYLELNDIKRGWIKLDYINKSDTDLRTHLNAVVINNDLMLIHGALNTRESTRKICVLNKEKKEIIKLTPKLLDTIREEAKHSKELERIFSIMSRSSFT